MILERSDAEGEIPVDEMQYIPKWHQSSTGHVKPGMKQGGPPPKAKYYPVTDRKKYRFSCCLGVNINISIKVKGS